jgi:hypothetical protein
LAKIQGSHDGSSDDEKGHLLFYTNSGGSEAIRFKIDSNSRISLSNNDSGGTGGEDSLSGNTLFGYLAGEDIASGGLNNTFIGHGAAKNVSTGDRNVAVGCLTLGENGGGAFTGSDNVAIGFSAGLMMEAGGEQNVIVGAYAGDAQTVGDYNVLLGYNAGTAINAIDANGSTFVGHSAGAAVTSGIGNTAIGYQSLDAEDDGDYNTAVGYQALTAQTGGANPIGNTAVGYQAGLANTSATLNTYIGYQSGLINQTGSANVMVGFQTGIASTDIDNCVLVGYAAGTAINADGADGTVAVGRSALAALTVGAGNTAVGCQALEANVDGTGNAAFGYNALRYFEADALNHGTNTAVGYLAGLFVSTGTSNTFLGSQSGQGVTGTRLEGNDNTAVGYGSGYALQGAALENTLLGSSAGIAVTTGTYNVAVGANALDELLTGTQNVAIGVNALHQLDAAEGYNVAVGSDAGANMDGGSFNTVIGSGANIGSANGTYQTAIGYGCTAVDTNNSVTLGNADVTAVYMAQDSGAVVYCAGVNFPDDAEAGVADVNTLDAYEEGYWAIAITGSTSGSQSTEASWTDCAYTKIGRVVHVQGEVAPDNSTDTISGSVRFSLPFAVTALTDGAENAYGTAYLGNNGTTLAHNMWSQAMTGQSYFQVRMRADDGTTSHLAGSQVDTHWVFGFGLTYITDE